jgi:hypothetical protein
MGPLTKIAVLGVACLSLLLCGFGLQMAMHSNNAAPAKMGVTIEVAQIDEKASPVNALVSLTEFKKLSTLNPESRSINAREKKILYWLYVAEKSGMPPMDALNEAFKANGNAFSPKAETAKLQTLANYKVAKEWGFFTTESLSALKRGNAAKIIFGSYAGEFVEIDHIVPLAVYPQFANELANLQLLPTSQNRSKGDRMGNAEYRKLEELQGNAKALQSTNF